ncbi:hypothetical protein [Kutzneria buriramensis]|uniref:Uncharacterized protein n=1 Tax=Kutzneria buriramensis TaxID=1045776 RepID=A0A3E0G5Z9_9PSEU|nr:hypothetical protein [Kutzneria buriramensis]REH18310.1 hypothetical protein BCF44_13665 [Kutzneria buriramensis]
MAHDQTPESEPATTEDTVSERVTETVVARDCAGCGGPITYKGRGRRGQFCSARCRQKAWALRAAGEQLAAGEDPRPPVVREVVERTTERVIERVTVKPVPIAGYVSPSTPAMPVPSAPAAPTDARGWIALLAELEQQLLDPQSPIASAHWNHRRLFDAVVRASAALGHAHPGGLDRLSRH